METTEAGDVCERLSTVMLKVNFEISFCLLLDYTVTQFVPLFK